MFGLFKKLVIIVESLIAAIFPTAFTPTLSITPEAIISPTPVIENLTLSPEPTVVQTPTPTVISTFSPTPTNIVQGLVSQLQELKQEIINYTPEPTPSPQIIYIIQTPPPTPIPTPIPTPAPTPLPEVIIGSLEIWGALTRTKEDHFFYESDDIAMRPWLEIYFSFTPRGYPGVCHKSGDWEGTVEVDSTYRFMEEIHYSVNERGPHDFGKKFNYLLTCVFPRNVTTKAFSVTIESASWITPSPTPVVFSTFPQFIQDSLTALSPVGTRDVLKFTIKAFGIADSSVIFDRDAPLKFEIFASGTTNSDIVIKLYDLSTNEQIASQIISDAQSLMSGYSKPVVFSSWNKNIEISTNSQKSFRVEVDFTNFTDKDDVFQIILPDQISWKSNGIIQNSTPGFIKFLPINGPILVKPYVKP